MNNIVIGCTNEAIIQYAHKGIMIDIGANKGMYTTKMSPMATKVYAFEPHPSNLDILREKCKDLDNVVIEQIALSDREGIIKLFQAKNPGGHSISTVVADVGKWTHTRDNFIEVRTITLDEYVRRNELTNITAIKIDVEGAEEAVLSGMQKTLRENECLVSLETHQTINCTNVADLLINSGYKIWSKHQKCLVIDLEMDRQYYASNRVGVFPK